MKSMCSGPLSMSLNSRGRSKKWHCDGSDGQIDAWSDAGGSAEDMVNSGKVGTKSA